MHHRQPKLSGHNMHPQRLGHITAVLLVSFVPGVFDNPELIRIYNKTDRSLLFDLISPAETSLLAPASGVVMRFSHSTILDAWPKRRKRSRPGQHRICVLLCRYEDSVGGLIKSTGVVA